MSAEPKLRLILVIVFLIAIGYSAILPSKVCWKDFYRRDPVAKGKCSAGKQLFGFLCYEQCPASMPMTEFDCYDPSCPIGFTSQPISCTQYYDRNWSWPVGYSYQSENVARKACEWHFGRGECTTWQLYWRPRCKDGYTDWVGGLCKNVKINCSAYGFTRNYGAQLPFCLKDSLFIVPSLPECPEGSSINGLSCYKPCKEGYQGVGPYCWKKSPWGMVNCGIGAAINRQSCNRNQIQVDNVTFSFINAVGVLLQSYRLQLIPKDNEAALKRVQIEYFKESNPVYKGIQEQLYRYNPSDPKGKSELYKNLMVKDRLPQYNDSMNSLAYILKATGAIPDLQVLSFMIEFVSLFDEEQVSKMIRDMNLPPCSVTE